MRKIICFLGARPSHCTYLWMDNEKIDGEQFAEVLLKKERFDQMLVFVTKDASINSFPLLSKYKDKRIKKVPIPDGKNSREIWKIFERVIERVNEGDEVVFDITHGFRSLPFLSFLFAAYLKTARNAQIVAIYYGALEMARSRKDGLAPVLELSEFVKMLDWIIAADQFIQTSDARRLSTMLETKSEVSKIAANNLEKVSLAAFLCQPFSLGDLARLIQPSLVNSASDFSTTSLPFTVLANRIGQNFDSLAINSEPSDIGKIHQEYRLLHRYFKDNQWIQAITLAREWIIDIITVRLNQPLDFSRSGRSPFEKAVNVLSLLGTPYPNHKRSYNTNDLDQWGMQILTWPDKDLIINVWQNLRIIRNQIDHAEHQSRSIIIPLDDMRIKILEIEQLLENLAQSWFSTDNSS